MVRVERETSNSFGADLFEILEDWEAYLQAENIDFDNLSQDSVIDAVSDKKSNKTKVVTPAYSRVKPHTQRLEP